MNTIFTFARTLVIAATSLFLLGVTSGAWAAETEAQEQRIADSNRDFAGFSFGVGFSVTLDTGTNNRVSDAIIDANGIVRVNESKDVRARVVLESHYLFPLAKVRDGELLTRGWGPFLALQPGDTEIIQAIGAGVMLAFRRSGELSAQSFNIAVGFMVDPSERVLGAEFQENRSAPTGPGGAPLPIRFEQRDQGGVLGLISFAW